ncbi:acyl-CoA dehydrogenase family protein [Burkholderia aenigmatica]|uniref:acyl-CoA dehydrogenase family protein n=1 Tax=Burkholderia cepacia complex TaxID=87882 RepID=UPI000F082689|nr:MULTISPECIES: acyl-CoA dehydrogenase family protein [Burkholderia cepacia complex]AYQ44162.1 acyl-CoA dehydrogenase [Burkholderia lata]UKD17652.1 acyl-CoA dehydrogenase family protein [Burkholderia aenigmatica]
MITFDLSEEQELARNATRSFAQGELRPIAQKLDRASAIPASTLDALWSTGLVQMQADDGQERCSILNAIVLEELAAADATLALALATPVAFTQAILDQGSAQQREKLLPVFQGHAFHAAAIALMEPHFGSDVSSLTTTAVRDEDGWRLNGRKTLVPLASAASHFLVVAQADGERAAFIVERNTAGCHVEAPVPTVGLRALGLSDVRLDGVCVPHTARLGNGAGSNVQRLVDSSRAGLAAVMTGLSRGVMEYVIPYAKDRVVHGSALASKQSIAFRLADMHIDVAAMRLMGWRAASELANGKDAARSAQLAYTYAARQSMSIADEGLQIFGGHGFVREHPIEMWYRNARAVSMLEGVAGV